MIQHLSLQGDITNNYRIIFREILSLSFDKNRK